MLVKDYNVSRRAYIRDAHDDELRRRGFVEMNGREMENIRRDKLKYGYDPYNTAPIWASWLKMAADLAFK
jgi:hypothetical protein